MRRKGRGKTWKASNESNGTRDRRWVGVTDSFRKKPWAHKDSPQNNLKAFRTDWKLEQWWSKAPFNIRINTLCAEMRIIRQRLTKDTFETIEIFDLVLQQDEIEDKGLSKKVYFSADSYPTNASCVISSLMRYMTDSEEKWRAANNNAIETPSWIENWDVIDVTLPKWKMLAKVMSDVGTICLNVRGPPKPKAKAMKTDDHQYIQSKVVELYFPKEGEDWIPNNLNKAKIARLMNISPDRSANGWWLRTQRDHKFGSDSSGKYVQVAEPIGTKTNKTVKQVKESWKRAPKMYAKKSQAGCYRVLNDSTSLRPIRGIHTTKKINQKFFLRPKKKIITVNGKKCGFENQNLSVNSIRNLMKEIAKDFGVEYCTLYGMKKTVATTARKLGVNPEVVADIAHHNTMETEKYYQDERTLDFKTKQVNAYESALINGKSHINNNIKYNNSPQNVNEPQPIRQIQSLNNTDLVYKQLMNEHKQIMSQFFMDKNKSINNNNQMTNNRHYNNNNNPNNYNECNNINNNQ
eukprot:184331_1